MTAKRILTAGAVRVGLAGVPTAGANPKRNLKIRGGAALDRADRGDPSEH
jgi:hypothetical protein